MKGKALGIRSAVLLINLAIAAFGLDASSQAQSSTPSGHWVSAWSAAMHAPLPFPGLPPTPVFENQTIRIVVRPTIGGERVRIRLSNAFGNAPITIAAAHVALSSQGSSIVAESDRILKFSDKGSVTLPREAPMLSDP